MENIKASLQVHTLKIFLELKCRFFSVPLLSKICSKSNVNVTFFGCINLKDLNELGGLMCLYRESLEKQHTHINLRY